MEASLLAVTPAPVPPQETVSQTPQTTDETTPFTTFLSEARATDKKAVKEKDLEDVEASTSLPGQQEILMESELTALATMQLLSADSITTTPTDTTEARTAIHLTMDEFKNLQTMLMLTANGMTAVNSPALNNSQAAENAFATTLTSITDTPAAITLTPDELKSLQTMLTANGMATVNSPALNNSQAAENAIATMLTANGMATAKSAPISTDKQTTNVFTKADSLVTQQLQAILGSDSRNTLAVQTSPQSAPSEALSSISSPYLHSADSTSGNPVFSAQSTTMLEGTAQIPKSTDAKEGLHHKVEGQYLNFKFEALDNKNNSKSQQQDPGQRDNANNQQNIPLTTSLANNEQTSQFIVTGLGVPSSASTSGNAPVANQTTFATGTPIPAEEIISHLVERFSSNPRLQTSKISLNLNPAELGALKIDIMVKGDSIKAHIVAGSQQIQETIEKYMPKLRTILEQQGFNIEDFQVTLESTNSDSQNFFQKQFSSRHDSTPQKTLANSETAFDLSLNIGDESLNTSTDSGVNLSI